MKYPSRRVNPKSSGFRGFVAIPKAVLRDPSLSHGAKIVYGGLAGILRRRPDAAISQRWLARWLHLDRATVGRGVAHLEAAGWLSIRDYGRGRVRRYVLDAPAGRGAGWVNVPRVILRAAVTPLARLVYAVALDRSGGKPRRMSCTGLARLVTASRAAVAWAWVRLVATGWLTRDALGRGTRRLWETLHGPGWARAKGQRGNPCFRHKNGVFRPGNPSCTKMQPPLRKNAATQENPSRNLTRSEPINRCARAGPRAPGGGAAWLERFRAVYPGPLGDPGSAQALLGEATAREVALEGLLAAAEQASGRWSLVDWLFCQLFHVERV